jgi:hypothetical protein
MKFTGKSCYDEDIAGTPEGSWRYGQNLVTGEKTNAVSLENGFENYLKNNDELRINPFLVGTIPIEDTTVLFTNHYDDSFSPPLRYGQIGIVDPKGYYNILVSRLSVFKNTVQGRFAKNYLNQRIITWWNGIILNQAPGLLNIDELPFAVDPITYEPLDGGQNKLKLFPDLRKPRIKLDKYLNTGCKTKVGSYQFRVQYEISNLDYTNCVGISSQVSIFNQNEKQKIHTYTRSGISLTGIYKELYVKDSELYSNSGVVLKISNLDKGFKRLRLIAIIRTATTITAEVVGLFNIDISGECSVTYAGQKISNIDLAQVLIPTENIKGIKSGVNLKDILTVATLKVNAPIDFQRYANNIKVFWKQEQRDSEDLKIEIKEELGLDLTVPLPDRKFIKDPVFASNLRSLRPNEVYAFYVHLVRNDGTETEGFHIPGRPRELVATYDSFLSTIIRTSGFLTWVDNGNNTVTITSTQNHNDYINNFTDLWLRIVGVGNYKIIGVSKVGSNWEIILKDAATDFTTFAVPQTGTITALFVELWENTPMSVFKNSTTYYSSKDEEDVDESVCWFHLRETAHGIFNPIVQAHPMGFWENLDEYYPDTDDFDVWNCIGGSAGSNASGLDPSDPNYVPSLRNQRVRHHHTPKIRTQTLVSALNTSLYPVFNDIQVPAYISEQIQSIYFSYAIRDINTRTVLGTGIVAKYYSDKNEDKATETSDTFKNHLRFYDFTLQTLKPKIKGNFLQIHSFLNPLSSFSIPPNPLVYIININEGDLEQSVPPIGYQQNTATLSLLDITFDPQNNTQTFPKNVENDYDPNNIKFKREECVNLFTKNTPLYFWDDILNDTIPIADLKQFYRNIYLGFQVQKLSKINDDIILPDYVDGSYINIQDTGALKGEDTFIESQSVGLLGQVTPSIETPCYIRWCSPCDYNQKWQTEDASRVELKELNNNYQYNPIFSAINNLTIPEANNFTFIRTNLREYDIMRSNPIKTESQEIGWRTFLVNRYYIMPRNKGIIWTLGIVDGKDLVINMESTVYLAELKDKLSTINNETYLGVADIFDRVPLELVYDDQKYAGCQSQWACVSCKHGYIFPDKKAGKWFLLSNGKLNEISKISYRNFFRDFSDSYNSNEIADLSLRVLDDNPAFNSGCIIAEFDEANNRLLVTNKRRYYDPFKDEIVNDPYTISYGFNNEGWTFFHTYIPTLYSRNNRGITLYKNTVTNLNTLYQVEAVKFAKGNYGLYFFQNNGNDQNLVNPAFIDVPFVFSSPVKVNSSQWVSEIINTYFNFNTLQTGKSNIQNETITHIQLFTLNQITPLIPLKTFSNVWFKNNTENTYGIWSTNNFEDILLFKNSLAFDQYGKPILNSVNNVVNWFDLMKLISKFVIVRYYFDNLRNKESHLIEVNVSVNPV